MAQDILAVARAIAEPAQQVNQLRVESVDANLLGRFLAVALDEFFDLEFRLGNELLDPGWMDAAVGDKLAK